MIATDIVGWTALLKYYLVFAWTPSLIVSIIILVVAIVIADVIEKIVKVSAKKMGVNFVNLLGTIVKVNIYFCWFGSIISVESPRNCKCFSYGFVGTLTLH